MCFQWHFHTEWEVCSRINNSDIHRSQCLHYQSLYFELKWRIEVICAGYGNTVTCKVICFIICSWWQDTCWYPSHQDLLYHLENWPVHLDRRVCLSHQAHRPCPRSPSREPGMCKTWDIKHSEKEWGNSISLFVNLSSINSHVQTNWNSLNQNCNTRVLAIIFSRLTFLCVWRIFSRIVLILTNWKALWTNFLCCQMLNMFVVYSIINMPHFNGTKLAFK